MIACISKYDRGIGHKNKLLFDLPEDMSFFRDITLNKAIIMGSNTARSFKECKPLPGRVNYVITREYDDSLIANGFELILFDNIDVSMHLLLQKHEEIFVIGGQFIYELFIDKIDKLYLSIYDSGYVKADSFFPDYSNFKVLEEFQTSTENLEIYSMINK